MQFESKGKEEYVDLKAELLAEGSLEKWKHERELEWKEVKKREEESRRSERPAPPTKSLYEQLKERKDQKDTEQEQKRSLKNYVYSGPTEEELNLIQSISTSEVDQRRKIEQEERNGLVEFRKIVECVKREENEKETMNVIQNESVPILKSRESKTNKSSLKNSVVVNRKRSTREVNVADGVKEETGCDSKLNSDSSAAKRPALVSYSSDSDSDVGGKGKK